MIMIMIMMIGRGGVLPRGSLEQAGAASGELPPIRDEQVRRGGSRVR